MRESTYMLQSFTRRGEGLSIVKPQLFASQDAAIGAAEAMLASRRAAGVIVQRVVGDSRTFQYERPEVIFSRGRMPAGLLAVL